MKVEFVRPEIPAAARVPCAPPARLPDRDMTAADVTTSWGLDRSSLRTCEARRAAAVAAVDEVSP